MSGRINLDNMSDGFKSYLQGLDSQIEQIENNISSVSVKNFGAKGDGENDDTNSIKQAIEYASLNNLEVFFPSGEYYVTDTINIDVEKTTIKGVEGETTISINKYNDKPFKGEVLINVYSGSNSWDARCQRVRTIENFYLRNYGEKGNITGLRLSGKRDSEYEGHVERLTYRNFTIRGFNVAIMYSSHVYAIIIEKFYFRENNYGLKSEDDQYDSGEIPVIRNCFFADASARIKLNCGMNFHSCTFHSFLSEEEGVEGGIEIDSCKVSFIQCHFERIQPTSPTNYLAPLIHGVGDVVEIIIAFSTMVVSGDNKIKFRKSVINCSGKISLISNDFQYFYRRILFDNDYCHSLGILPQFVDTCGKGVLIYNDCTNYNNTWDASYHYPINLDSSPIYNYNFKNTEDKIKDYFKLYNMTTGDIIENNDDISLNISYDENTELAVCGNNTLKVSMVNNTYGGIGRTLGLKLNIPDLACAIGLACRIWFTGSNCEVQQSSSSIIFLDEFDNVIDTNSEDYKLVNNNKTYFIKSNTINEPIEFSRSGYNIVRIPRRAKKAIVGIYLGVPARSSNNDFYIDYFLPYFI